MRAVANWHVARTRLPRVIWPGAAGRGRGPKCERANWPRARRPIGQPAPARPRRRATPASAHPGPHPEEAVELVGDVASDPGGEHVVADAVGEGRPGREGGDGALDLGPALGAGGRVPGGLGAGDQAVDAVVVEQGVVEVAAGADGRAGE